MKDNPHKKCHKDIDARWTKKGGETFWLDAGYVGPEEGFVNKSITPIICERGFRGDPLNEEQKRNNRSKSKVRCRVEHVFGFIERLMGGLVFRGIGTVRVKANIAMTNLTYNIARLTQIYRYHKEWITVQISQIYTINIQVVILPAPPKKH